MRGNFNAFINDKGEFEIPKFIGSLDDKNTNEIKAKVKEKFD